MFSKVLVALMVFVALSQAMPKPDDDYYRWGRPSFGGFRSVSYHQPRVSVRRVVVPRYNVQRFVAPAPRQVVPVFRGNFLGRGDFDRDDFYDNDRYDNDRYDNDRYDNDRYDNDHYYD